MSESTVKRCPKCEATKPLSEFHKDKSKAGGCVSWCKDCANAKKRADYDPAEAALRYQDNRDVVLARTRAWQQANPDTMRRLWREAAKRVDPAKKQAWARTTRLNRHGGAAEWERLYDEQQGLCYLCQQPLPDDPSAIHVDHDHDCCPGGQHTRSCPQCRRGLAHERCNQIWGLAREDPEMLRRIADNGERVRDETKIRIATAMTA